METNENKAVVENEEVEAPVENSTEAPAQPKVSTWTKVKGFGKKHGKKVAAGAAALAVGVLGYILGRGSGDGDVYYGDDFDEDALAAEEDSSEDLSKD